MAEFIDNSFTGSERICYGNIKLKVIDKCVFLGVIIDNKLKFDDHFN